MNFKYFKQIKNILTISIFFITYFLFSHKLYANKSFEISGNERVENITILNYIQDLGTQKNSQIYLDNIRKILLETELFSEVDIFSKNNLIKIKVVENPIIYETKFVGNKKIDTEILTSEIMLKKRSIFTKSKLQSDLKRINDIYVKSGRFLTKIEPKIIQKEQNRIELIFEIDEGKKASINDIYFIGNHNFSDKELQEQITTAKSIWWKFLSSSDVYDSDRIEYDKEMLRRFYNNKGYADFNTISSIAQINRNKNNFFITFLVEEGIKYNFGEIKIINYIEKFDPEIINEKITIKKGETYNAEAIENIINNIVELMSEKSYAFANIEPKLIKNKEEKTIDVNFIINESPRIFINHINISGNTRTIDEVIRRELRIKEGDAYNINKINRSKQRLENLNFFEKVEINSFRDGNSDKINIEINVKEKKTGELNLGVGYSSINRSSINAGIRENNFLGTGRTVALNVQKSFTDLGADFSYNKPYFLDRTIDVGFDVARANSSRRAGRAFETKSSSFQLNAGYSIMEFLNHYVSYSYKKQVNGNFANFASSDSLFLTRNFLTSAIDNVLSYDKTNNRIDPRRGYFITVSHSYAGLGGNVKYSKFIGKAAYFMPTINEDIILRLIARGGYIQGVGQDLSYQNYLSLNGNDIRGFDLNGIGSRAKFNRDIIFGGKIYYILTTEIKFPLGLPRELGINGALFFDNGVIKGVEKSLKNTIEIYDSSKLKSSFGISISWSSPVGPIRLDFSRVLKKADFDRTRSFNFNFGTNF